MIPFLAGVFLGALLNWASDLLPQLAASHPERRATGRGGPVPRLWRLLASVGRRGFSSRNHGCLGLEAAAELIMGVLVAYLWQRLAWSTTFVNLVLLCALLVLIAVIDLKYRLVLNVVILPAMVVVLVANTIPFSQATWISLLGGGLAFFIFAFTAFASPGRLGGGDIKLAAFLGLTFGFPVILWALLAGAICGGATAVFLLLARRWHAASHIPYAPFLCFGALIALFYDPLPWLLAG